MKKHIYVNYHFFIGDKCLKMTWKCKLCGKKITLHDCDPSPDDDSHCKGGSNVKRLQLQKLQSLSMSNIKTSNKKRRNNLPKKSKFRKQYSW